MLRYVQRRRLHRQHGFTLLELLVVIAIVGLLVLLLLPAIQASREAVRRLTCQHNLRQLALAAHSYHEAHGSFPPGVHQSFFSAAPVHRGTSLFVHMLPYFEEGSLYDKWDFEDPLNNASGGTAARTAYVIGSLICPADTIEINPTVESGNTYALTSYGGNGGSTSYIAQNATVDGIFHTTGNASDPVHNQATVRIKEIVDGSSRTILLGERSHFDPGLESFVPAGWTTSLKAWGWWAPSQGRKAIGHVTMSSPVAINYRLNFTYQTRLKASPPVSSSAVLQSYVQLRLCAWGSAHPGGANLALADGSSRFMNEQLPLDMLIGLSTRSSGEVVALDPQ